jgi:phosphocarrier protein
MELKVKIIDPIGLHARPASQVVTAASKFEADIKIVSAEGKEANLKSIMSVMAMGVKTGEEITIIAEGSDAEAAIREIESSMKENELI